MSQLRVQFVGGGDPGPEVVAALTAVLTRPIVVLASEDADEESGEVGQSPWVRAARLEAIVPGRRIATRADLAWRR